VSAQADIPRLGKNVPIKSVLLFALSIAWFPVSLGVHAAWAVTTDGRLDPDYGPALSTQTTQTSQLVSGDNTLGWVDYANGSELDEAYGFISSGVLHLLLSGNLMSYIAASEPSSSYDDLEIFIDSQPGGQNVLRSDNPDPDAPYAQLNSLAGLTFDSGFAADFWIGYHGGNFPPGPYTSSTFYAELLPGGGGTGYFLGFGTAGGPGTLTGGTNPNGVLATIDNRNIAGVTAGCGAASGAGVSTGIELAIPLAAIGNPAGCVNACVFVDYQYFRSSWLSNQVLGPLPPGTCSLGFATAVNFAGIPGSQFVTICPPSTPARRATWGSLKAIYR
jgi:hypothetical protein